MGSENESNSHTKPPPQVELSIVVVHLHGLINIPALLHHLHISTSLQSISVFSIIPEEEPT